MRCYLAVLSHHCAFAESSAPQDHIPGPRIFRRNEIVELGEHLGHGQFARVRSAELVTESGRKAVAVKRNELHAEAGAEWKELLSYATPPPHPNIVRFLGVLVTSEYVDFVMELASGGSLEGLLRDKVSCAALIADENRVVRLLCDILGGLHHLHSNKFVHRDVAARKRCVFWFASPVLR